MTWEQQLQQAKARLTTQQYRAWRLYEAGFSIAMIARALDISSTRAKQLVLRAQRILATSDVCGYY